MSRQRRYASTSEASTNEVPTEVRGMKLDLAGLNPQLDYDQQLVIEVPVRLVAYEPLQAFLDQYEGVLTKSEVDFMGDQFADEVRKREMSAYLASRVR